MTWSKTSRIVLAAAVLGALVWLVVLDRTLPAMTRGGRPFVIPALTQGGLVSQEFGVWVSRGLSGISVDGEVTGGAGAVDAALIELEGAGAEREVRRSRVPVSPGMSDCCDISFERVRSSAGKRFRLDLRLEAKPPVQFKLWLVPTAAMKGGLAINGRQQSANLRFDLAGAIRAPVRGAGVPLTVVLLYAAVVTGMVAAAARALLTASNPRPS